MRERAGAETQRARVAITGAGAVSPLGADLPTLARAALAGASGIRRAPSFVGSAFEAREVGAVVDLGVPRPPRRGDAANLFARLAVREALSDARIELAPAGPRTVALVLGSTIAPRDRDVDAIAAELASSLGLARSLVIVVETACTSGTAAVALGALLLRGGHADVAIAGGADELDLKTYAGFAALQLLAPSACTPFGAHVGTTLGEGAAFFVLERAPDAVARGATVRAFVEGDASAADAFHPTSPHPSGDGLLRAIHGALADAGHAPEAIDWVSAHGTGTRANDAAEVAAILAAFGARGATIPVAATKSQIGHGLGAAGALELAVALVAMEASRVPPTLGAATRRPGASIAIHEATRDVRARRVMKLGAAFGGANSALVLALPGAPSGERAHLERRVFLAGTGAFGGGDPAVDPAGALLDFVTALPPCDLERLAPGVNPRGLDALARSLVVAIARALDRPTTPRASPDRIGLFVGQRRASPRSVAEFDEAVEARGLENVPGGPFTRRVLNTATGAASRARSLRGPTSTISTGRGSGLAALVLAADHLATRDDADQLVVAAVDEGDADAPGDGAVAIVLTTTPTAIELVSWRIGSIDELAEAPSPDELRVEPAVAARSAAGLLAVARAARELTVDAPAARVAERGALASARVELRRH